VRLQPLLGTLVALALLVAPRIVPHPTLFIWNASPSVPVGLYWIIQASPQIGDLAVLRLPPPIATLATRRGYLPRSAYLLKPIAAVVGDRVCRFGTRIFVRDRFAGRVLLVDSAGATMPAWHGCRILRTGQLFVLAADPASFDSRYFGPLDVTSMVGRAVLLWAHRSAR
jgi:conjugative transfer signal peptidase TraF